MTAAGQPRREPAPAPASGTGRRIRIGALWIDAVTFSGALDRIAALVDRGCGGAVFTPNVDHVVLADDDARFRDAYQRASLALPDGAPIPWAARLLGTPIPEKVSGSDLVIPLARLAAARGWRVFLLGGAPMVAERVAERLARDFGVAVVGRESPMIDASGIGETDEAILRRIRAARPHLLLVALGAPKQELWIDRHRQALGAVVSVAVGASLDFLAGHVPRAPRWMSRAGLEWLYRLAREPRRLWRRYLVRDPRFLLIVARTARLPRAGRQAG